MTTSPSSPSITTSHPLARLVLDVPVGSGDDALIWADDKAVTRGQARSAVLVVAAALRDLGVRAGDAVATVLPTSPAAVIALFGIWAADAVAVPVNPRLTPVEIGRLLASTGAAAVIARPGEGDRWTDPDPDADPLARIGRLSILDRDTHDATGSVIELDLVRPIGDRGPKGPEQRHGDGAAIVLTTSGTTGQPKPVVLNDASVLEGIDTVLASLRGSRGAGSAATAPPPNLIPVPLALWAGVYNTLFAFRAGAGIVLLDPFVTAPFANAVRTHQIKSTVLAPAMIAMLNDDPSIDDLAPLRIVRSISAPLSPHQARRFHERFGAVVLNSYGQTELGGEVIGWRAADARSFGARKLGAIGRPHEGIDVRVLDGDVEVAPGEEGELCVRSPYMMQGYLTDETNSRVTDDGFLRTGDIGHIDEDGFVWLSGRVSDLIIRGGLKVFPADIEELLLEHPLVRDAAVVGIPDDRLGEVPWAFIVTDAVADDGDARRDDLDRAVVETLEAHCREVVAAYKVPARFVAIEALPRNDVGKVLRRDLVALAGIEATP